MPNNLKTQLEKSIRLAHLKLDKTEKKTLIDDLEKILDFVALIEKTQKEGEKEWGKKIDLAEQEFPQTRKSNVMREDRINQFENQSAIRANFPEKNQSNLIKVKKI